MPYLQLDISGSYPTATKRDFAKRLGQMYADIMQTTPDMVDVAIRKLADSSLWRCGQEDPEPAAVLLLDIRRGRPADQRARLAEALVGVCVELFHVRADRCNVEFTQHSGDESYGHVFIDGAFHGGFAPDWTPDEAKHTTLLDSIPDVAAQH